MPEIVVRPGTPADATHEIAAGVAIAQRDAYAARFPGRDITALENELSANPFDPGHIRLTRNYLKLGPEQGWFWALALTHDMGYLAVNGFALSAVHGSEISLMELHVHPHNQRQGLGRRLAELSIRGALQHPDVAATGYDTPISLYVARARPDDMSEHPARWYRSIGFTPQSHGNPFVLGDVRLTTQYMEAPVGDVLAALADH